MKFDLRRPCPKCPFRTDVPGYLTRGGARDIADALRRDATFSCHQTNSYDDEGDVYETSDSQHCAGALIVLEREGRPNQMMRIAERLRFYDRTALEHGRPGA